MNIIKNIFPKVFLSLLALLSLAFFVVPVVTVEAQSGNQIKNPNACVNRDTGELKRAYLATPQSTPQCPESPWYLYQDKATPPQKGLCLSPSKPFTAVQPSAANLDTSGTFCVITANNVPTRYPFFAFSNMDQYTPVGTTTPPIIPPPATTTQPGTTPTPGGNNTTQVQGGCDANFHAVGPLCVPNSNFNQNSLVGTTDGPGLAIKIIRFMLYFAGIVAVIMAIIGGYQIMTAAGNATQATNGRKTLTNAIIGLVIVVMSFIIVQAVVNFVSK